MKRKFLIMSLLGLAAVAFAFYAAKQDNPLDPRKIERSSYEKNIRELSKKYGDKSFLNYDPQKSFDLYLTHFFKMSWGIYARKDCFQEIENMYSEFDLIYFKTNAKEKLQSYCSYSIEELMNLGDEYAQKTKSFDYNTLNAMHFYYNTHMKALDTIIDSDGDTSHLENLTQESYDKFKNIRNQLPKDYIQLSNYTPFDPNAVEDF